MVEKERDIQRFRQNRSDLKGSCEKVLEHREALDKRAAEHWSGWALLLGEKRKQQRVKLSIALNKLYADDQRIIDLIESLMTAADNALKDVRVALGSGSSSRAYPENVPKAAELLTTYEAEFRSLRDECLDLAVGLRTAVKAML